MSGGSTAGQEAAAAAGRPVSVQQRDSSGWRARAVAAVNEYGAAWTAQDAARIAQLFTEDAVYVERPFDDAGTFRGREAIREYWTRQVRSHQTNIRFRQLDRELLWDSERCTALAKWEAAFDKKRRDGTTTPCHFVQVAVLRFTPSGHIESLEEYWHSTTKQRRHDAADEPPAVDDGSSAKPLPAKLQAATETVTTAAIAPPAASVPTSRTCSLCGAAFATRNQLFAHLRGGGPADASEQQDVAGCPVAAAAEGSMPLATSKKQDRFALLVAYTSAAAASAAVSSSPAASDGSAAAVPAADIQSLIAAAWSAFTGEVQAQVVLSTTSPANNGVGAVGNVVAVATSQSATARLLQRWGREPDGTSGRHGLHPAAIVDLNAKLREAVAGSNGGGGGDDIQILNIVGPCSRDFDARKCCERR
jgi:ketosteroid isomerase-like protein